MICASCSTTLDDGDPFCRNCGAKQPVVVAPARDLESQGVRRRLSVVFYDVVGSTELATKTDAEDLQVAYTRFQTMAGDAIRAFGGYPAQTMGDGGMAYFGYPSANEDDPVRAVSAGLAMIDELPALNARIQAELPEFTHNFTMRVGIHTGTVVVGELGSDLRSGRLTTGDTLNMAARIESKAPINKVAVSDVTAERIRGVVDLTSTGLHELKGLPEPVEIFAVDRVRAGQGRAAAAKSSLTSLAGREDLLAAISDAFAQAQAGSGNAVVLQGEAGIGKSRLAQALNQHLAGTAVNWIEIKGSALMTQSPFFPIAEALRGFIGAEPTSSLDHVAVLAATSFEATGAFDEESVGLLVDFLSGTTTDDQTLSAEERRERVTEALVDWLIGLSRLQPMVIMADDLHWFDPSTLGLLTRLLSKIASEPVLLLGTARPEFVSPWDDDASILAVEPLGLEAVSQIVTELVGGSGLSDMDLAELVRKSDGVPLFAEELALAAVNSIQTGGTGSSGVPATLIELLQARLDRLGPVRHCLQVAALVGDEFSAELATAIIDVPDLPTQLATLVDERFLAQRGIGDRVVYSFRHALMQDAASDTMLRRQRQSEHLRIAEILERQFAGTPSGRPEILGHHYERGAEPEKAVVYFRQAADEARVRYALMESIAYFKRSLELVPALPESLDRDAFEVDLHLDMGSDLGLTDGFAAPEARVAYESALSLCRKADQTMIRHFEALQGLSRVCCFGTDFDAALASAAELEGFAEAHDHRQARLSALLSYGQVHYWQGRFAEAASALADARELYDPAAPRADRYGTGIEMGIIAFTFSAFSTWALGEVAASIDFADQATALAEQQDDEYQVAYAYTYASIHAIMLNDVARCARLATVGLDLAQQHGFTPLEGLCSWTLGWARAADNDPGGLDLARVGVGILSGMGAGLGAPGCMGVMAEMCAQANAEEEGEAYVLFGLAMAAESSHDFYLAEIHRSAALIHLCAAERLGSEGDADAVATSLAAATDSANTALSVARDQGSPTLEARAQEVVDQISQWEPATS